MSIARGNSILWLWNTKLLYFSVNVVLFCLFPLLTQRPKQLTFGPCKLTTRCHRKKKKIFMILIWYFVGHVYLMICLGLDLIFLNAFSRQPAVSVFW